MNQVGEGTQNHATLGLIKETGSMWIGEDSRGHTNSNTQILLNYSEGCQEEGSPRGTGG